MFVNAQQAQLHQQQQQLQQQAQKQRPRIIQHSRRHWTTGIRSKMDAPRVMQKVFGVLCELDFEWKVDKQRFRIDARPRQQQRQQRRVDDMATDGGGGGSSGSSSYAWEPSLRVRACVFKDDSGSSSSSRLHVLDLQWMGGSVCEYMRFNLSLIALLKRGGSSK